MTSTRSRIPALHSPLKDVHPLKGIRAGMGKNVAKPDRKHQKPESPNTKLNGKEQSKHPEAQTGVHTPAEDCGEKRVRDGELTDEDIHVKMTSLATRISSLETTCVGYKESLEFTQGQVEDLQNENSDLRRYIDSLELEIGRNTYAVGKLETKQDKLEVTMKKKNVVFEGVEEVNGEREDIHKTIKDLLGDMGITNNVEYDAVYRVGQKQGDRPRPILISFMRQDAKEFVFSKRANLKNSDRFSRVWVVDDVTPSMRRFKSVVREVAKEARSSGAKCTSTPFSVTIEDKKYTEANLQDLPRAFSLETVKMKRFGDALCYHSKHAPFSNLYLAHVPIGNHDYLSTEQAYFHIMATQHDMPDLAAKILWSRDPYDIMSLGNQIETNEEWDKKAGEVLYQCMLAKFRANKKLRAQLLSTGDMELVEATFNKKWGAGATLNSRQMKKHEWLGKNLQGIFLMKIRKQLRDETVSRNEPTSTRHGATATRA